MPTVNANGIDIYYEITGSGQKLLFISGTGGDLRVRPNVFDGALAPDYQILAYDQRGLGQTEKPAVEYHMRDYADDAAALLDVLGWPAVPVVGVSFGGMVAQELALRHPARILCLVLACTSAGGAGGASYPLQELDSLDEFERVEKHLALADVRRDAAWRAANPQRWAALLEFAAGARRQDRDVQGARRQLAARAGHDTFSRLEQLSMPVLLAGGEFDGIAPPSNMTAMARQIPGSELRFFTGGHLFLAQDKSAYPYVNQWIKDRV